MHPIDAEYGLLIIYIPLPEWAKHGSVLKINQTQIKHGGGASDEA